jgi:uncharacterized membrane protein YccF (DUF307 family)
LNNTSATIGKIRRQSSVQGVDEMHCTTCDAANAAGSEYCHACGATLQAEAPKYVFSTVEMSGPVCRVCNKRNPAGAKYCVYCAMALPQSISTSYTTPALQPTYAGAAPAQALHFSIDNGAHLLLRVLWFFFIGWWLGLVWIIFAWLFNLTIIGLPIGVMMLNAVPQVMTLKPRSATTLRIASAGTITVQQVEHPFVLRALWFVLIGWWASFLWIMAAWLFSTTLLLMPIAFWMFDRVPTITTLAAE